MCRAICDGLGALDNSWASGPEIAWRIAGEDRALRREVYGTLDKINSSGVWETVTVVHNHGPLRAFKVRRGALREYLEGLQ